MKIGRNAPCPCGSGKKYKKCCLGKENVSNDLLWRRLGEAYDRLSKNLMNHGRQIFGEAGFVEALDEFFLWPEDMLPEEALAMHEQMFFPWYLFNWIYDPVEDDEPTPPARLEEITIAVSYKKRKGVNLDPLEHRLIDAIEGRPFTFYEIIDSQPGIGYRVKDFFLGEVIDVKEKMGSESVQKGDLLFGRVATIDAVSMLFGSGSIIIRPTWKPYLIHFRKWLIEEEDRITIETLTDFDFEIREVYFEIFENLMQPPEIRSLESMFEEGQQKGLPDAGTQPNQDDLMQLPEVQEQLRHVLQGHWQNWIDERIPGLGGRTPRQVVNTADGKESVEALLLDAERHSSYNGPMQEIEHKAIEDVRRKLGLDKTALPGPKPVHRHDKKSERVDVIKTMIEDFGREELNTLYLGFAIELLNKISRMRKLNIQRGHIEIWAAAIVYVIARLNFLFDPESDVSLSPDTICDYFGTVKSTVGNKASLIQKTCDLYYGAEGFCRQDIIDAFTFIETSEGFVLPKNMLGNFEIDTDPDYIKGSENSKNRSATHRHPNKQEIKTKSQKSAQGVKQSIEKKPKDDKQLKLFDDL